MKVKLTYFRQDGRQQTSAEYESAQTSFAAVVAEVYSNSRQQGKSAGLTGRADCYHIVINAEGQNAVLYAAARKAHKRAISRRPYRQ